MPFNILYPNEEVRFWDKTNQTRKPEFALKRWTVEDWL